MKMKIMPSVLVKKTSERTMHTIRLVAISGTGWRRLRHAGFRVEGWSRYHGAWTGRPDALSFQDIIVVEKASGS